MKSLFKWIFSLFLFPLVIFKGLFLFLTGVTIGFWRNLLRKHW